MSISRRHFIGMIGEIGGALMISFSSSQVLGQFADTFGTILYDPYGACDLYGDTYDP